MPVHRIRTAKTSYGVHRESEVEVKVAQPSAGWLHQLVRHIANESCRNPIEGSDAYAIATVTQEGLRDATFRSLAQLSPARLTLPDVRRTFARVESLLIDSSLSPATAANVSRNFRKLFFRKLCQLGLQENVSVRTVAYQTRLNAVHPPRKLVSDFSGDLPPIGATPHTSARELRNTIQQRIRSDLDHIRGCASSDLKAAQTVRQYLQCCAEHGSDVDLIERVQRACGYAKDTEYARRHRFDSDLDAYIGALVIVLRANAWVGESSEIGRDGQRWGVHHGHDVTRRIKAKTSCDFEHVRLVQMLELAAGQEMFAAAVVIQCHTGWNIQSVLALCTHGIRRSGVVTEIQSTKTRTDDDTPCVSVGQAESDDLETLTSVIDERDHDVHEALRLLEWNHQQMLEC